MNKHWEKASPEQVAWADAHGFVVAPAEDLCLGCMFFIGGKCIVPLPPCFLPDVIFKLKERKPANE